MMIPRMVILLTLGALLTTETAWGQEIRGEAYPEVTDTASKAEDLLQRCQENLQSGDIDAAIRWGEMAVEAAPENPTCHLWLGHAYGEKAQETSVFKKTGYALRCKEAYERAVALAPDDLDFHFALLEYMLQAPERAGGGKDRAFAQAGEIAKLSPVRGHYALAMIHLYREDYEEAEKEIHQAIELDADDTRSYHLLAVLYQRQHDDEKMIGVFHQILEIDPADDVAGLGLCKYLLERNEYEKVKEISTGIIARGPDEALAYFMLAIASFQSGEDVEAGIGHMETFLDRNQGQTGQERAKGFVKLGRKCEETGDLQRAVSEYEKALEWDPKSKDAKKALRKLQHDE